MMMKYSFMTTCRTLFVGLGLLFFISCNGSKYQSVVKKELASGVEHKALMFGMDMGLPKKDFYKKCWELNKEKLLSQGPSNQYVRHVLDSVSPVYQPSNKIEMLFFGLFDDADIMKGMRFRFNYTAWSPWVEELQPDKLKEEIKTMMMTLYPGNAFFDLEKEVKGHPVSVKIDGNRLITVYVFDNRFVQAYIEDLNTKYDE